MRASTFLLAVLGFTAVGCSRAHIAPSYGLASRTAFAMQEVKPAKPPPPPNMALDTQEADVIGRSYVRSLAGKAGGAEPESMLYLSPQRGQGAVPLAPSVPRE